MLEDLYEGDIDDIVKELAKGCGVQCVEVLNTGMIKDMIKSKFRGED
jgi:hypothetical protein